MEQYTLRYDGGGYIGKCPIYDQAMGAARGYAKSTGLSVLVAENWKGRTREIVVHPGASLGPAVTYRKGCKYGKEEKVL